jgi:hyaluronoglucosaminidase
VNIESNQLTHRQSKIIEAFFEHQHIFFNDYHVKISIHGYRHTSREGFEVYAHLEEKHLVIDIGITVDRAIRYALNSVLDWVKSDSKIPLKVSDGPQFPVRGVVEGFYGKPWTHEQRLRGIPLFADFGMNTYFLAPKDDPLQRFNWRSPFTNDFLKQASELIELGSTHGIDFVVCVSPGLSVRYSDDNDISAVINRFKQLMELGATHFGLLWDDIDWELQHPQDSAKYATIAQAHADFTNKVWGSLVDVNAKIALTVCPMQYSGRGDEPYVIDLGHELNPRINLMWTGREICSAYLDIADAVIFTRSTLRPPLYWDNFPVNDGSLQSNLHIGPVRGREKGLHKYAAGLLSNPMVQFEASLLPLATVGDYLWNSDRYEPDSSWERALVKLYPSDGDRQSLRAFLRTSMGSFVGGDPAPDLRRVFHNGVTAWRKGDLAKSAEIFRIESDSISFHHKIITSNDFAYPLLSTEISEWLEKYRLGAQALAQLANFLLTCTFDNEKNLISGPSNSKQEIQAIIENLHKTHKSLFGDQIEGPLNELSAELQS